MNIKILILKCPNTVLVDAYQVPVPDPSFMSPVLSRVTDRDNVVRHLSVRPSVHSSTLVVITLFSRVAKLSS